MNNFFCSWPLLQLDNVAVSSALRIKALMTQWSEMKPGDRWPQPSQ